MFCVSHLCDTNCPSHSLVLFYTGFTFLGNSFTYAAFVIERRHVQRHVLGERICEFSVEESLKQGMVCVGRYVNYLWKSL